jgi:hypothetical protein
MSRLCSRSRFIGKVVNIKKKYCIAINLSPKIMGASPSKSLKRKKNARLPLKWLFDLICVDEIWQELLKRKPLS